MLSSKIKKLQYEPIGLVEGISRNLMHAILNGVLKGGEQLIEAELQEIFSVSKSPVREALRDLESKGLVEIRPRKGAFVKPITRADIVENYKVRAVLEALAVREAYEKMGEDDFEKMKATLDKMVVSAKNKKYREYFDYDHEFHKIYLDACQNTLLIKLVRRLRIHNLWYNFDHEYYKRNFDLAEDVKPHVKLVEALQNKKITGKKIEEMMREMIEKALQNFLYYVSDKT
ncbi:MAG: GntR family transcriptional regulator [Spirochaetaceae bacterium]|nr:MAG: GntR family transcriptional regulator [Spirochaetaceae bacterium]